MHLHFGAVDHDTTVWVNGVEVARHRGGFTPFTADLTGLVAAGESAAITVRARDSRHGVQARGKQATWAANSHWSYTRTTGIWQTVWLEAVQPVRMRRPKVTPQVGSRSFAVVVPVNANRPGLVLRARLLDAAGVVATEAVAADLDLSPALTLRVPEDRVRLWSPADSHLYDLDLELLDGAGEVVDRATSYAGLRSVTIDGTSLLLNGRPVFQRLVLDQGYWPESIMTAPSDAALVRDIELGMAAGFNGARLHQKVFEERYLYHADRLGYLVWAEFGDWGASGQGPAGNNQQPTASFITQWVEVVERDYNHPSIVGWCPLNETHQELLDRLTVLDDVMRGMFLATSSRTPPGPSSTCPGTPIACARPTSGTRTTTSRTRRRSPRRWRAWRRAGRTPTTATARRSPCPTPGSRTSSASSAASGGTRTPPRPSTAAT